MTVVRCEMLAKAGEIENAVNIPQQVILRHYIIEIERQETARLTAIRERCLANSIHRANREPPL